MRGVTAVLAIVAAWWCAGAGDAGEKKTRILLVGKDKDHARASHEYMADCTILAKCLRQTPGVEAVVVNGWPARSEDLKGLDAIVLNTRLGGDVAFHPLNRKNFESLANAGVGIVAIHWATGADKKVGQEWLDTMGGWFNTDFSKYLVKNTKLEQVDPSHPICRGWKDFPLRDEYYIQLKYLDAAKPVLKVAFDGKEHVVAWTYERPKGGRSFGTVLGHFHDNYAEAGFRKALVNGILWSARVDPPADGAPVAIVPKDLELPPDPKKK